MSSSWYQQFITTHTAGGGGSIGNLNKALLEGQQVLIPSLAEQEQIGAFFQALDERIAVAVRQIEKFKALKQAFLEEMFV